MSIVTARIYWDDQDSRTVGWAWATRVDGEHDSTGPLGDGYPAESEKCDALREMNDEELIAAFHCEVNSEISADEIEIVR